jgi:hypothetical protein
MINLALGAVFEQSHTTVKEDVASLVASCAILVDAG